VEGPAVTGPVLGISGFSGQMVGFSLCFGDYYCPTNGTFTANMAENCATLGLKLTRTRVDCWVTMVMTCDDKAKPGAMVRDPA